MAKEKGTKDHPWTLKTPAGTSEFTMYKDESIKPPVVVWADRQRTQLEPVWFEEGIAWSLWNVYSTINRRAWSC